MLASPNQQALLHLEPEPDQPWWVIRHARTADAPAWQASFGARTPAEIIAAFTDALTDPETPTAGGSPYEPLRNAGWQPARDHSGLTSPDGIVQVEHFTETSADAWFIDVAISGDPEGLIWRGAARDRDPGAPDLSGDSRPRRPLTAPPRTPAPAPAGTGPHAHRRPTTARLARGLRPGATYRRPGLPVSRTVPPSAPTRTCRTAPAAPRPLT
ncbi:DUF317 domain-containing protein [Streptomyces avidinii]|uniref:DUF317 domain-containing protein n=1 Tax=Streptomyces avidinii TaxID=1895 RepID=UPI0037A025E7